MENLLLISNRSEAPRQFVCLVTETGDQPQEESVIMETQAM
jgi:hypothetical protein